MFLALNILLGNEDTQSRNTMLYSPQNSSTWYVFNWDCDVCLRDYEKAVRYGTSRDEGWQIGVSNYWSNILFQKFLKEDDYRELLDQKIQLLRSDYLTHDRVQAMVDSYATVIKPYLYTYPDYYHAPVTEEVYDEFAANMVSDIETTYQWYLLSLERPMPFYMGKPVSNDQGIRFDWDASYDFDADLLSYRFAIADNIAMENPIISTETFSPFYQYQGTLPAGGYYYQVCAVDDRGNEQYGFDIVEDEESILHYGMIHFYVMEDGSIYLDGE